MVTNARKLIGSLRPMIAATAVVIVATALPGGTASSATTYSTTT